MISEATREELKIVLEKLNDVLAAFIINFDDPEGAKIKEIRENLTDICYPKTIEDAMI